MPVTGSVRKLKVRQRHRPWRVKRETGEKGARWTEWNPTSLDPSRSSRLSRLSRPLPQMCRPSKFCCCELIFPQLVRRHP